MLTTDNVTLFTQMVGATVAAFQVSSIALKRVMRCCRESFRQAHLETKTVAVGCKYPLWGLMDDPGRK
jgi:hypothetical protein